MKTIQEWRAKIEAARPVRGEQIPHTMERLARSASRGAPRAERLARLETPSSATAKTTP